MGESIRDQDDKNRIRKEIGIDETKKKNKSAIHSLNEMDASMVHPIVWTHYRNDEHRALSWKGG